MHIELLWLFPIFAFAGFLFFVAYYAQRKVEMKSKGSDLSKEVALFNAGHLSQGKRAAPAANHDERLRELEKAINVLANTLSTRESGSVAERAGDTSEMDGLKEKLRTVFKEYDILMSENYSLRAKVKQLMRQAQQKDDKAAADDAPGTVDSFLTRSAPQMKPNLHLYGDTRLMKIIELEAEEEELFRPKGSAAG